MNSLLQRNLKFLPATIKQLEESDSQWAGGSNRRGGQIATNVIQKKARAKFSEESFI